MMTIMGLISLLAAIGCAGPERNFYSAAELPPSLAAPHVENTRTINLSKLAVSANSSELIDNGDVLEVTISSGLGSEDNTTFPVRVGDNGVAMIPVIGNIPLAGYELEGAEQAIAAACIHKQLYRNPNITVTMKRQRTNRVTVVGAIEKPGTYNLPRGSSDLLSAIVAAGGLAKDAGWNVEIRNPGTRDINSDGRPGPSTEPDRIAGSKDVELSGHKTQFAAGSLANSVRIDLIAATTSGNPEENRVRDGAVINIEKRDPMPIQVIGLVRKPGRHEFPPGQDLRLLDAIALAEGLSMSIANKVYVIRRPIGASEPAVVEISLSKAKMDGVENMLLAPGDVVSVEHNTLTYFQEALSVLRFGIGAQLPLNTFF